MYYSFFQTSNYIEDFINNFLILEVVAITQAYHICDVICIWHVRGIILFLEFKVLEQDVFGFNQDLIILLCADMTRIKRIVIFVL
jgi:hypothetical protein